VGNRYVGHVVGVRVVADTVQITQDGLLLRTHRARHDKAPDRWRSFLVGRETLLRWRRELARRRDARARREHADDSPPDDVPRDRRNRIWSYGYTSTRATG
jgi:hypothetical protein